MAAITPALLDALYRQYQFQFTSMYNATPTYWPSFASEMPSGSSENVYAWLEQFSGMRQWQGSRQVKSAIGRDYRLTNIPFELTVGLPRAKIADDQHGFFGAVIENMGMSTKQLPDQRLSLAVEAGTTALCWDGQPFFADAHPVNLDDSSLGTYDNNLTGASYNFLTDPKGTWAAMKAVAKKYKDGGGKPLAVVLDTVMVGPDLEDAALTLANAQTIATTIKNVAGDQNVAAAGITNIYAGSLNIIINPFLTSDPLAVYGLCTKRAVKPFLWQNREAADFIARTAPDDPNVFDKDEILYGSKARGAAGYGLPWTCVRAHA
jgi:phage major head subunit gpT-like protein